ncbi:MAG TPA: hypothetical protein VJQ54_00720, partial [Candidatus Sulfotelmatobacter sp.]|nr:hypothetical protein [Candidatus Sulfotelmatobacter sp.]
MRVSQAVKYLRGAIELTHALQNSAEKVTIDRMGQAQAGLSEKITLSHVAPSGRQAAGFGRDKPTFRS